MTHHVPELHVDVEIPQGWHVTKRGKVLDGDAYLTYSEFYPCVDTIGDKVSDSYCVIRREKA